jgi:protein EFR3
MVHADHETRVGAHRIFSLVLVPSSVCPQPSSSNPPLAKATDIQRMLSRNVSVFSSSAALFEKLEKKQLSIQEDSVLDGKSNDSSVLNRLKSSYSRTASIRKPALTTTESTKVNNPSMMNRLKSSYSRVTSVKRPQVSVIVEEDATTKKQVCICTILLYILF